MPRINEKCNTCWSAAVYVVYIYIYIYYIFHQNVYIYVYIYYIICVTYHTCKYAYTFTYLITVLLPFGGNRTHVMVPKDILTMITLYHLAFEVLIEIDKYFDSRVA